MEEKRFSINKNGVKFYLNVGSLVIYDKKPYYICCENDEKFLCVPFKKGKRVQDLVLNDFYFDKLEWVNNDETFKVVGFLNNEKKLQVMKKYRLWLEKKESENIKRRGCLLEKNNEYFYIYGENANILNLIKVYIRKDKNLEQIRINSKSYYTLFEEEIIINNDDSFVIKDFALEDEMKIIKNAKKVFKKMEKEEINLKDIVTVGTIITLKSSSLLKLVVCKVFANCILAIPISGLASIYKLKWDDFVLCDDLVELDDLTLSIMEEIEKKYDNFDLNTLRKKH